MQKLVIKINNLMRAEIAIGPFVIQPLASIILDEDQVTSSMWASIVSLSNMRKITYTTEEVPTNEPEVFIDAPIINEPIIEEPVIEVVEEPAVEVIEEPVEEQVKEPVTESVEEVPEEVSEEIVKTEPEEPAEEVEEKPKKTTRKKKK